jgi:hypothetical protein
VIRRQRGEVEVVERPDTGEGGDARRQIRTARLVCHYHALWQRGTLDDGQREACDRYLMEAEAEAGAQDRPTVSTGRTPPWQQGHLSDRQLHLASSLRRARAVMGTSGRLLCDLFIIENLPVRQIAERRQERQEVTMGQIKATLTRLAELWGME